SARPLRGRADGADPGGRAGAVAAGGDRAAPDDPGRDRHPAPLPGAARRAARRARRPRGAAHPPRPGRPETLSDPRPLSRVGTEARVWRPVNHVRAVPRPAKAGAANVETP